VKVIIQLNEQVCNPYHSTVYGFLKIQKKGW
jgi:hypothetical protein